MKKNRRFTRYLAAVLCVALLLGLPGMAGAEEITYTWDPPLVRVQYDTDSQQLYLLLDARFNKTGVKPALTLQTFSVSAVEGIHFTPLNTQVNFGGSHYVYVNAAVTPKARDSSSPAGYWYQTGTERMYGLRVIDEGGYELWRGIFPLTTGTQYISTAVNSVADLLYISDGGFVSSSALNQKYNDVELTGSSYATVTDDGYGQRIHTYDISRLQDLQPTEYLQATQTKVAAAFGFMMKEENDGYQYIQILADKDTEYDPDDDYGQYHEISAPSKSLYKACFELSATGQSVVTDEMPWVFPHASGAQTQADAGQNSGHTEFPGANAKLYQQRFRSGAQAPNAGALLLEPNTRELDVRFDASGSGEDDWYFRNLFARIALLDTTAPNLLQTKTANGRYANGNEVIVSLCFDEIVNAAGTSLDTTWGTMNLMPESAGTNVATYSGTVSGTGELRINEINGTVRDLAGNAFTFGNTAVSTGKTVGTAGTYSIGYILNGGTASNPTGFTVESAPITLNDPVREGYTFAGWTDSLSGETAAAVTIPTGSRATRIYQAGWNPVNYAISYELNGGTVSAANRVTYNMETETFTLINPKRTGYAFLGWTGTGITGDPAETVTIPKGSMGERSYTANWSPINYSIGFNLNGGSAVNPTSYHIESDSFTLVNPTRPGCVFTGWTGTGLDDLTKNVIIPKGSTGDRNYTANWVRLHYRDWVGSELQDMLIPLDTVVLNASSTVWTGYVLAEDSLTIAERVTVCGNATLILLDGCNLTVPQGITVNEGDSLTICGQNADVGKQGFLTITTPPTLNAGIGGSSDSDGRNAHDAGYITVLGGRVTVTGNDSGAGIGGSERHSGDHIVIRGGDVTVSGSVGAGIGGGIYGNGTVTITGGKVTANTTGGGAGIGGGQDGDGRVAITNGTVITSTSSLAAGIGSGIGGSSTVMISGGNINATSSSTWYPAIGGNHSDTTISGGTVVASSVKKGIAGSDGASVTLTWNTDANGTPLPCSITVNEYGYVVLEKPFIYQDYNVLRVVSPAMSDRSSLMAGVTITPYDPSALPLTLPPFGIPTFTLPAYTQTIDDNAFEGDTSITVVDAGNCQNIDDYAFKNCTGLTQIRVSRDCDMSPSAFDGCTSLIAVYGPAGGLAESSSLEMGIHFVALPVEDE
ncbi:MAG: InlB B-repeat-containing protein [Clostridia bacterium]|nr:InlB B-repeat-containing protein [Clostridia bacterium]